MLLIGGRVSDLIKIKIEKQHFIVIFESIIFEVETGCFSRSALKLQQFLAYHVL